MENLQTAVAEALGVESEATVTEQTQTQQQPSTEPTVETQTTTEPTVDPNSKDNTTIRQMREQIANEKRDRQKAQDLLQRIADEKGLSIEELEEDLQKKLDQKKATQMNVSPEIAAQIRMQEQRIKELEEQNARIDFNNRVHRLQAESGLNEAQTLEFLKSAQASGFNPLSQGMDLNVLYRAMNFEKISAAKEAEIRQQILNEMQEQRDKANTIPTVKTAAPVKETVDTPEEFMSSLLSKLNK